MEIDEIYDTDHSIDEKMIDLHQICSSLARPFFWYTEKVIFSFSSKKMFFQEGHKKEYYRAAYKVFSLALSAPMIPIALFLTVIEMPIRLYVNLTQKKPFTYKKGKAEEKIYNEDRNLSIFSLNTCFVAGGFPVMFAGVYPWSYRLEGVSQKILAEDADIVCLQEVNDVAASYALYDKLKDSYAHFYINIGPATLSQNSGLFIASKYPISNPNFFEFNENKGLQKAVNKGCFDCEIISQNKKIAHIFTAHFPPSKSDETPTEEEKQFRKEAFDKIFVRMNEVDTSNNSVPFVLAADMNASINSEEFEDLSSNFKVDSSLQGTCLTDFLVDKLWKDTASEEVTYSFDNVLLLTSLSDKKTMSQGWDLHSSIVEMFSANGSFSKNLSDHHGIKTTLTL
jgi:exonuclease III